MSQSRNFAGLSAQVASAITGSAQTALTAAGSTAADAFLLPADVNRFGTVAASTGTILPPMNAGDSVVIYNGGANALTVYPPAGATINQAAASYSVTTTNRFCTVVCVSATVFIAGSSA